MKQIGVGTFHTTKRMRELVDEVLDSGRISYGPMSQRFEREFAALHGNQFGVLSNSGTSSLHVALQTLKEIHGWQDGDEVIVPAVTFVATVNVILHNNLKPVLVDVEPDYYGIDPKLIYAVITPRTRAIIPVHLFGQPCNMADITMLARNHDLKIVEDSCECMFADHYDQPVGAWSDIACFSTYVAHLITTGVGGLAITNNPKYAEMMRSLVNHGRDGIYIAIDDDRGVSDSKLREIISRRFRFPLIGHSFRITELEAALGVAQLETWQNMIAWRREHARYLTDRLTPFRDVIQLPAVRDNTTSAWMMYPIIMRYEVKTALVEHLESQGIETREMLPLTNQPAYQSWCNEDAYPVAKWINSNGFYVGCHQDLMEHDLDQIVESIGSYIDQSVGALAI